MPTNALTQDALAAWRARSCDLRCLDIIDFCSSQFTMEEIAGLLTDDTTLGQLGITPDKCDRCVRALINRKIRVPAGKPRFPRSSVKPSTKIRKLISNSCS